MYKLASPNAQHNFLSYYFPLCLLYAHNICPPISEEILTWATLWQNETCTISWCRNPTLPFLSIIDGGQQFLQFPLSLCWLLLDHDSLFLLLLHCSSYFSQFSWTESKLHKWSSQKYTKPINVVFDPFYKMNLNRPIHILPELKKTSFSVYYSKQHGHFQQKNRTFLFGLRLTSKC